MTKTFNISFPKELADALDKRARAEKRSRSEVLRAAALAYLEWWRNWRSLRRYGKAQARKLGITPADVDRLIQEVRKQGTR